MSNRTVSRPAARAVLPSLALLLLAPAHARTLRVKADAPGPAHDGAAWATAYLAVQQALAASAAGDEIWVARGIYKERITVTSGVALYGGFAGAEAARDQRNPVANPTVLDASKQGVAVTFQGGAKEDTRLDGFTVTNGQAINGAGIVCTAANPTIANNRIVGNISTGWAGAIECFGGSPTIAGNVITGNFASGVYGDGGAIHVTRGGAPVISGNVIAGNIASQNGGGIAIFHSSPTITGNIFRGNVSFVLSIASSGGYTNRAALGGGAIFGTATDEDYRPVQNARCEPVIANNIVQGNAGDYATGGICLVDALGSSALVANNTIVANSGAGIGWASTAPRLVNNIVAWNLIGFDLMLGTNTAVLGNNCVYHNGTMFQAADYVHIPDATGVNGNLKSDPQIASVAYGNAHIQPGSPCIGAGDGSVVGKLWTDVDGQRRVVGAVDIGADESDGAVWNPAPARVCVKPDGNDANSGESWALAKKSIQAALDVASALGGEVWAREGTYNERVILRPYAYLYGGFAGTETARDQRDPAAHATVLDGGQNGNVVIVEGGYLVSRLDGLTIRNGRAADDGGGLWVNVASPVIAGCTISDNSATNDGGGLSLTAAHPVLIGNAIVRNKVLNTVSGAGGGLDATFSSPILIGNVIAENLGMSGTGVSLAYSDISVNPSGFGPVLIANDIYDNKTASPMPWMYANDGGVRLVECSAVILRNTISGNEAMSGGGLSLSNSGGRIADNLIVGNHATMNGGGIIMTCGTRAVSIENNTIAGNVCDGDMWHEWGGAMCITMLTLTPPAPAPVIVNNIMAYNSSGVFRNEYAGGAMPVFRNNCVFSNTGGGLDFDYLGCPDPTGQNGNMRADPKFVALNPADLRLQAGSPCIDTGDDTVLRMGDADWYGTPRLVGAHVDIGAVESGTLAPYTVDDVRRALRALAGLEPLTAADAFRLNIAPGWPADAGLDLADAAALARKAFGLG